MPVTSGLRAAIGGSWISVRLGALLCAGLALQGCASVRGRPYPITAADIRDRVCPSDEQMDHFAVLTGDARGAYRDRVISMCIGAYNRRYADFTASLSNESISTNLAVDLASAGLTTVAGIAAPKTAKRLTAGAGFALGLGSAVSKDVFYQTALPALLTAMDAKRSEILTDIVTSEKSDPLGINYPLARAAFDLDRYEDAGTLSTGMSALARAAETASAKASQQLEAAQRVPTLTFTPVILDPAVLQRVAALTTKVKDLKDTPADRAKLDALAAKLGLRSRAADRTEEKIGFVVTAILDNVNVASPSDQQARITALEAGLSPLL